MRPIFFLAHFAFFTLFATSSFSQVTKRSTPDYVEKIQVNYDQDLSQYDNKTSNGQLYLLSDRQVDIKSQTKYVHIAYKLLTTKGVQNYSEIDVSYDPAFERVAFHHLVIVRDGKIIDRLKNAAFNTIQREESSESLIYDGSLTSYLNLKDVRVNDIIDYAYSISGFNPIYKGKYAAYRTLEFCIPVDQVHYRIVAPESAKLQIKKHNGAADPVISSNEDLKTYTWRIRNSMGLIKEDKLPGWYSPYAAVSVSQYTDWVGLGSEVSDYYTFSSENQTIKNIAAKIVKENPELKDQINSSIEFVQDEVRYLGLENGISAYKPKSPQQIIQQRFGDCKDKSLLLVALLHQLDVKANAVLVNTYDRDKLTELLPGPASFNHCVVRFFYEDSTIWIDPTIREQGGKLNEKYFPNYGRGLVLDGKQSALDSIPVSTISSSEIEEELDISSLSDDHELKVKTTYFGNSADREKKYFRETNIDEISLDYAKYYEDLYDTEVEMTGSLNYEYNDTLNTFTVIERYLLKNIWKVSKELDAELEATISNTSVREFFSNPSTKSRKMPYDIVYPKKLKVKSSVKLPMSYTDNYNKEFNAPGAYAKISRTYKANYCDFLFEFETTKDQLEPDELAEYIAVVDRIEEQEGRIFYYSEDDGTISIFSGSSSKISMFIIFMLIALGFAGRWLYLNFNPQAKMTKEEDLSIGGWLVLPAIGIVLAPTMIAVSILFHDDYGDKMFDMITDASSKVYDPSTGFVLLMDLSFYLLLFVFSITLLLLFFKKRTSLPLLMVIFYGLNILFKGLTVGLSDQLGITQLVDYSSFFGAIISSAIWIPYFLISERVKNTFTVQI